MMTRIPRKNPDADLINQAIASGKVQVKKIKTQATRSYRQVLAAYRRGRALALNAQARNRYYSETEVDS